MFVRPKMGYVRAKIGLTGQFDRRQPGNYLQPCRLRHARGLMGRDKGKIAMKNFLSVPKLSKLKVRLCQQGARVFATSVVCL